MRELNPVRLTGGGAMLLLVDAGGAEYVVAVDSRLRDTLGRSIARPSDHLAGSGADDAVSGTRQKEPTMQSAMRPREIQDRVRAGESAEDLAAVAGAPVEKVLAFAGPVLAERAHVAQTALDASVRRTSEGGGSARALGESALARLREDGSDPETLEWDAWRREDGRWTLQAAYRSDGDARTARFTFDQRGRFVTAADPESRWLVGDAPLSRIPVEESVPLEPAPTALDGEVRRLRLAPLPDTAADGPLADRPAAPDDLDDPTEPVEAAEPSELSGPLEPSDDDGQLDLLFESPSARAAGEDPDDAQDREDTAGLARRHPRKQRGRASVPSWDEIMFGGRD